MAAITVPRVFDAFRPDENVDAGAIKRRSKRIRVQRLAPLVVGLLVTMRAVGCVRKSSGLNEIVSFNGYVARRGELVCAKAVVVAGANLVGIFFAI